MIAKFASGMSANWTTQRWALIYSKTDIITPINKIQTRCIICQWRWAQSKHHGRIINCHSFVSIQWNSLKKRVINSMLVQKIITCIKLLCMLLLIKMLKNGVAFKVIRLLLQRLLCIRENQWLRDKEAWDLNLICLNWCSLPQWIGQWNYGIQGMNQRMKQSVHLKAAKNTFMMSNGHRCIQESLPKLMLTDM